MSMTIRLLGEPAILGEDGEVRLVRGHQSWALLVRVVLSRSPLDRRRLASELFPETVDPLGSLRWCLASLRKALDCSECLSGDPVEARLPAGVVVDVLQLEQDGFDIAQAGQLLGSMEPKCSQEFSTWLLVERERIAGLVESRIRQETMRAISVEDYVRAVRLAELGVRGDTFNESAHVLLVKSLALGGRYDAAVAHVDATEAAFLAELGEKPSIALRSAARRTISSPPGGVSPEAFVRTLIESGLAALSAGVPDAGIDCLRRAVNDAEMINDSHLKALATLELGTALVHAVRGYDDEGSVLLRQSTELARQSGSASIASAAFRELGYVEALAGRRPAAAAYLSSAVETTADSGSLAGIHGVIGFNLVDWGLVNEGLDNFEISLEHARKAGNHRREIWSLGLGAWGLLAADRLKEADAWLETSLTLIDQQRWIAFRPWPVALLAETAIRQGKDPATLRPRLEAAFAASCQLGDPCWEAAVARAMALSYAAADEVSTGTDWLSEAHRRCGRDTDAYKALQVSILADQADFNFRLGRLELADAVAREWISLAARTNADAQLARAAKFIEGLR